MTEQELIYGLCNREELAFTELVTLFKDNVFNTSLGFVQNHSDAEDITQEVFIQVYKSINDFKKEAKLSTWIYRITVTKCLDFLRSKKRKKRFAIITNLFGANNNPIYEQQEFNHPGIQLDKKEDASILFKLIMQLPQKQQTVFILNKIEDLSYNKIAAILNTTESAVDSLLQRAKQNLKNKIEQLPI